MTTANSHIAAMAPYALAEMNVPDGVSPVALLQNESLRPPSPQAIKAGEESLVRAELYPDPDWTDLRVALARLHGLDPQCILCGSGSLDLIGCLARAFAGPERAVLAPAHAYPFFATAAQAANARFDTAPERAATVDVDALVAAVGPDTAMVFLANPGNPTGTRIGLAEIKRLRTALPPDVLLVIDEAYGEFADDLSERSFGLVEAGNTVVLRTFSKAYGLAGLRVGWGVFPSAIAAEFRKVLNPNNVTAASQAAAVAALSDQSYMRDTCGLTKRLREQTADELKEAGFKVFPSYTNFLLIDFQKAAIAENADVFLKSRGILLRRQSGAGLPSALRMTIGPQTSVAAAVHALKDWKKRNDI